MNRRNVNTLLGLGLLASSLPVAIAACQSDSAPSAEADQNDGFIALGTVADLDTQGVLANDDLRGKNLAVVRDPNQPEALLAVSAVCTHAGCTVAWDGDQDLFVCPCHGARFKPDGTVQSGSSQQPLATFAAKVAGDQVLVKI